MATRPRGIFSKETELALIKQQLENITAKLVSMEQQLETKYATAIDLGMIRLAIAEIQKSMVTQDQFIVVRNIA